MSLDFSATQVTATEEKRIVTGLIVSDEFTKSVFPFITLDYFTNPYLKRIASWCISFYEDHGKAPNKHIKDLYESRSAKIKPAEQDILKGLLGTLSDQYDDGDSVNVEFLVQSAEEYFRKRELEIHINNIAVLKDSGDLTAAEQEISRFTRVSIALDDSLYIDPGDQATRDRLYKKLHEQQTNFFKFPGDLGEFLGSFKPGDVVGITAPKKKGKSWLLNDFFKHLILSKVKTIKWAIEMTDTEEIERFDKLWVPTINKPDGMYRYPVFDCMKNQTGDCGERLSSVLVREDVKKPFVEHDDHVVCTKCRYKEPQRFVPTTYNEFIKRERNDRFHIIQEMEHHKAHLSKYARIVTRPKYTLSYDLMMFDLDRMYKKWGFIPQALLLDYVDILEIASKFDDYRLEDEKWKLMQKLASATRCLVITPTQSNKAGEESVTMKSTDQGGFYGKGRHVNLMAGINQTALEKGQGYYRVSIMDARSTRSNEHDYCLVLQDLKTGQMHLDSYWPNKEYMY